MEVFKNKKILILIFLLLIIIVLLIWVSLIPTTPQPIQPTPSEKPYPNLITTPGVTKEDQIKALPNLKKITPLPDNQTEYSLSSPLINRDNLIITQAGEVVFERTLTTPNPAGSLPKLADFKLRYGEPQAKFEGSKYFGKFETVYLYPQVGLALVANPFTEEVDEVHTFTPMTPEEYLQKWGTDIQPNTTEEDIGH